MKITKFLNNPFIVIWMSVMFIIGMTTISCDQEDDNNNSQSHSSFIVEGTAYQADETISYKTTLGNILQLTGVDFKMCIVLSDNESDTYEVVDTLRGADTAKARAILKMDGEYRFSTSGIINYNADSQSGNFNLYFDDLELQEGTINTDTLREEPLLDFTKLRQTDPQGNPMTVDTADWKARTHWQLTERLVFGLAEKHPPYAGRMMTTYPNPMDEYVRIYTGNTQLHAYDMFIVNQNLELEASAMNLSNETVQLKLDEQHFKGHYYRFYYRIHTDNKTYYGSGDVKIKDE